MVTGFTSGSLDRETREYIVRDLDAHSWVEVWYPDIGWVTFDPTPALAPPRAQPDEEDRPATRAATASAPPSLRRRRPVRPRPPRAGGGGGHALGLDRGRCRRRRSALAAALVLLWRGRRRRAGTAPAASALAELERALRRTRQQPGPGTTLRSLEQRFAPRSPAAAGYVRALSAAPLRRPPARRRRPRSAAACGPSSPAGTVSQAACGPGGRSRRERDSAYTRGSMDDVYDLFTRGTALLEAGDFNSATVPLSKAAELEPEKASIREALGRAYFRSRQFEAARVEFEAVVERRPRTTTRCSASAAR